MKHLLTAATILLAVFATFSASHTDENEADGKRRDEKGSLTVTQIENAAFRGKGKKLQGSLNKQAPGSQKTNTRGSKSGTQNVKQISENGNSNKAKHSKDGNNKAISVMQGEGNEQDIYLDDNAGGEIGNVYNEEWYSDPADSGSAGKSKNPIRRINGSSHRPRNRNGKKRNNAGRGAKKNNGAKARGGGAGGHKNAGTGGGQRRKKTNKGGDQNDVNVPGL